METGTQMDVQEEQRGKQWTDAPVFEITQVFKLGSIFPNFALFWGFLSPKERNIHPAKAN